METNQTQSKPSPMEIIAPAVDTDVSVTDVFDAASKCDLLHAFQEWWDDGVFTDNEDGTLRHSNHPKLVITIEPTNTICTTVTVEYGGQTAAQVETWRIGNVLALLFEELEAKHCEPEQCSFASTLLDLLKPKDTPS